MNALTALVRKDLIQYFSNKRALAITLAAPILISAFFGSVLGGAPKKPTRVPVAVVDLDRSPVSRDIVKSMQADTTFDLREVDEAQALVAVRKGEVRAAAVFPVGFGAQAPRAMFASAAAKPEIVVHYDPSQAMTLTLVKGLLAEHVMQSVSRAVFSLDSGSQVITGMRSDVERAPMEEGRRADLIGLLDSVQKVQGNQAAAPGRSGGAAGNSGGGAGMSMPFALKQQEAAGRVDRGYNGFAHAFAGMGVQFVLFMGIEMGVGLLLMRRMGLWKRLRAAPVSRGLLLGSRVASGTLIAAILLTCIYAAAILVFGVRIDGSVAGFLLVVISFAILTASFGLLIAAVGKTPEATRGLAILATLMLVMLGGAWVPTFVFPEWLQTATQFVPTRWAIDGLEAMTWRGQGLDAVLVPVGAMLACAAVCAWIAVKRFGWEE